MNPRVFFRRMLPVLFAVVAGTSGPQHASASDVTLTFVYGDTRGMDEDLKKYLGKDVLNDAQLQMFREIDERKIYHNIALDQYGYIWADLDLDGEDEIIILITHTSYFCGTIGCWTHVLQNTPDGLELRGEFPSYGFLEIENLGRVKWPRIFASQACALWNGAKYEEFSNNDQGGFDPKCAR